MYYIHLLLIAIISIGRCYDVLKIRNTSYGYVNGINVLLNGFNTEKYAFFGIPYGEVKNRRFKASIPLEKWEKIRNFTSYGNSCLWKGNSNNINTTKMSEECLNLNVFTTKYCLIFGDCPVLLTVYGSGLSIEETNLFDNNYTLQDFILRDQDDVVVVVANHRTGIIGNLNLNSKFTNLSMNTNVGLFDIYDVLEWIKKEITSFGGNQNMITLMGVGEAAIESSMLLYLNNSKILFDKLILIPLSLSYEWFHQNNSENISRQIAIMANCANQYTKWDSYSQLESIITCLKFVDGMKLIDYENELVASGYQRPLPFIDFGNNSFFQYSYNDTIVLGQNIPVLMVGAMIQNTTTYAPLKCQFFINYLKYKSNILMNSLNMTVKTFNKNTSLIDKNLELFLNGQKECLVNFDSRNESYAYYFNYQSLNPLLYKNSDLVNESIYDIGGIFTIQKDNTNETITNIESIFQKTFLNFIDTGSLRYENVYNLNIYLDQIIFQTRNGSRIIVPGMQYHGLKGRIQSLMVDFAKCLQKYLYSEKICEKFLPLYQNEKLKKLVDLTTFYPFDICFKSTENYDSNNSNILIFNLNPFVLIIIVLYQIFIVIFM